MSQLQQKVANQIFPSVAALLHLYTNEFASFLERFRAYIGDLSSSGNALAATLDLGDDMHLEIDERLSTFLAEALQTAQTMIEAEETQIVSLLDNFVNDEVQNRISDARDEVTTILGSGTTWRQSAEVRHFYTLVKQILRDALMAHVRSRYTAYADYLISEAQLLPTRAISEAEAELSRAQDNIRAAMEAAIHGQRELFDLASAEIHDAVSQAHEDIVETFGGDGYEQVTNVAQAEAVVSPEQTTEVVQPRDIQPDLSRENLDELVETATCLVQRFNLINGKGGVSYSRLFLPKLLIGSNQALIVEPHLKKAHQIRNLIDFVSAVQKSTLLKTLWLVTSEVTDETGVGTDDRFTELAKDLFLQAGIEFKWEREAGLHDRYVIFDNGVLFKMGRGLDIYQPASGLALTNQELRRVRGCSIDVFRQDNA